MDQRVALDGLEPPLVSLHRIGAASSPLILASPHAGRDYRAEFLAISRLDMAQLRRTEDAFVDRLFQDAPNHGVPLLCANFPRSWLDVNRDEWELDPAMFADQLPARSGGVSARVAAGLGAIPRVASQGALIYSRKLRFAEAEQRLAQAWRPYHRALAGLIEETKDRFGKCILIDCHSMPSAHGSAPSSAANGAQAADIVLGDAFSTSCGAELVGWVESKLKKQGYAVKRNVPYAGGYVTRHYGKPSSGVHVLQLEIARSLYMDEAAIEPHRGFEKTRRNCEELISALARAVSKATYADGKILPGRKNGATKAPLSLGRKRPRLPKQPGAFDIRPRSFATASILHRSIATIRIVRELVSDLRLGRQMMRVGLLLLWLAAGSSSATTCEQAISAAEVGQSVPNALLSAIGQVESGRPDPITGRVEPWPWTADFNGTGQYFSSKAEAIEAVRSARGRGMTSIDVGCLQINLLQHPQAFRSLDEAFDPETNAKYGALFLRQLHDQLGSWPRATAAYHSETAALGAAYAKMVMRAWPEATRDRAGGDDSPLVSEDKVLPFRTPPGMIRIGRNDPPMGGATGDADKVRSPVGELLHSPGKTLAAYRSNPSVPPFARGFSASQAFRVTIYNF